MDNQETEGVVASNEEADPHHSLSELLSNKTYRELTEFQEPFDMFKAMRHHIGENESSAIIRFLVSDQETHGLGIQFLRSWLAEITAELRGKCMGLPSVDFEHVTAEVEWLTTEDRRLDILICLRDPSSKPVAWIGIENKHWAAEQPRQVSHYQEALAEHVNGLPSCVLFLTPSGRNPETGSSPFQSCPWLAVSYVSLLQAIKRLEPGASADVRAFLASFRNHLAANLHHYDMSDVDQSLKHRVHELFQDSKHRKAMLLLEKLRPSERSLLKRIQELLAWSDVEFEEYPTRGERLVEAKWYPKSLEAERHGKSISIGYMLTSRTQAWESEAEVHIAVMAWCHGIKDHSTKNEILSQLNRGVPTSSAESLEKWSWDSWAPIWVGGSYRLRALGDEDAQELVDLLRKARESTHELLVSNIKRLGWEPKK